MSQLQHYQALAQTLPLPAQQHQALAYPQARGPLALQTILDETPHLPEQSLLLGRAEDSLPVLLNLAEPSIGALKLIGSQRAHLRLFLYSLIRTLAATQPASRVHFGLISPRLSPWEAVARLPHCSGIFSIWQRGADDLIMALTHWAYHQRRPPGRHFVLLLIDGLENTQRLDLEARYNLEWLLRYGPSYEVWPIVAVDQSEPHPMPTAWQRFFRTSIHSDPAREDFFQLSGAQNGLRFQIPTR